MNFAESREDSVMFMSLRACVGLAGLLLLLGIHGCGGSTSEEQSAVSSGQTKENTAEDRSTASSGRSSGNNETPDPCNLLKKGGLAELVGADEAAITFEPGGGTHPYCEAKWEKPDTEELKAEFELKMQEYMERRMAAMAKGEKLDEKMPILGTENKVMLTVAGTIFASAAAAVTALESVVGQLAEGITVETEQGSATFRQDYDDWLEGVGDRAAWKSSSCKLSVAASSRMFHLNVRIDEFAGFGPPEGEIANVVAVNQPIAIELANRIIAEL